MVAQTTTKPPAPPVTLIRPRTGWVGLDFAEVWQFRDLLRFMVLRDLQVKYKQTVIGVAWAVLQPLVTMVVFSVFFGKLARIPSDGIPYPLFAFTALVPWSFFAQGLSAAAGSVVAHRGIITKVYFPRVVLPIAPLLSGLVDHAVALGVLLGLLVWYGRVPGPSVIFLPIFVLLNFCVALAVGLWLSALTALYRDVNHLLPFLLQTWMYASPVVYPSSLVPEGWQVLYGLNPMTGVIEGFRWALLGEGRAPQLILWVSSFAVLALLVTGIAFFRRMERSFVDVI